MELIDIDATDARVEHHFGGGVYAKQVTLTCAGTTLIGHKHKHDHLSVLARGAVDVTVDGITTRHCAPAVLTIKGGAVHQIVTLEPGTVWYCIHAIPEELSDPERIDATLIEG